MVYQQVWKEMFMSALQGLCANPQMKLPNMAEAEREEGADAAKSVVKLAASMADEGVQTWQARIREASAQDVVKNNAVKNYGERSHDFDSHHSGPRRLLDTKHDTQQRMLKQTVSDGISARRRRSMMK